MENTKYDDKFYRLPKRLFKEDQFRSMTNEAKTLYMILLDRRCLSECNGDAWRDEYGAIFIIFTIKEMMKLLHLGNKKINMNYDDAKENAAFERCVDVVTVLILKYGPAIKRKWILRDWIKNTQADCYWRSLACKRYQRYFDCMKAIVKNDTT